MVDDLVREPGVETSGTAYKLLYRFKQWSGDI